MKPIFITLTPINMDGKTLKVNPNNIQYMYSISEGTYIIMNGSYLIVEDLIEEIEEKISAGYVD